ncbi:putative HEAT repeat-containing domain protein, partial [Trichinella spiralis]|uniref:putative HEAT repeat-containing domain protein n=1 Tax=Trichinella spiralis TaxID=6334 RepID=UPI0001EFC562
MSFVHCILVVFFFAVGEAQINWICDAEYGYALKGLLYIGRSSEEPQIGLASTNVGQLAQPFVNSNRNVFMDRYFTSYSTVKHLFEQDLTVIGTVFAHRRDVLACLRKAAQRDLYSTLAVYEHSKKISVMKRQNPSKHREQGRRRKVKNQRETAAIHIEMLGGTTLHGRDAAVMLPEAQEALFLSDTKQKFGVFHKLVRVEEVSTMGIFTIMQVVVQNTDCQVSHDIFSYNDVLKKCRAESEKQKCRIEYKYHDPLTATALCVKKVEESIIIPQRDQRANRRRTIYIDSIDDVEEQ